MKLERPLAIFDLETTGLNITTERIVSMAITKIMPDGEVESKSRLIKPPFAIPEGAIEIHGITDEMVKDAPSFKSVAKSLHAYMSDCDLGGYNMVNYDLPLISEEFARCNMIFPALNQKLVDAGIIFKMMERRTLEAAVKFYCDEDMENAHDAQADVDATQRVLLAQMDRYKDDLGETVDSVAEFCKDDRADLARKIVIGEDGEYYYNFGKHKGCTVQSEVGFAEWMLEKDFPYNTKMVVKYALERANYTVNIPITPHAL